MSLDVENSHLSMIEELSGYVAAHAKNAIVCCLVRIRSNGRILDRFIEDGGIDILIKLLEWQNKRILDITLSILANVFRGSSIRDEIRPIEIANNVVWIIKNLTSGLSLHCRACRLIGNMAESSNHAQALFEAGVVSALGDVLHSKTNMQTRTMAVRGIRNIWTTNKQSQYDILQNSLVKYIAVLLVTYKSRYQDKPLSKYKEFTESCLKAIRAFADTSDPRSGEQIRIKNDSRGYKCIIEYCTLGNRISFQVLYQLSRIDDHRPILGTVGAIECIVKFLKANQSNDLNSAFFGEVIMSLCLFSREAVNRRRIRDGDGLEVMLKLLADIQNETHHAVLLHALTQFVFDDESIAIMIKHGIVNVLVSRLKRMVLDNRLATRNINDINTTSRKRSADNMSSSNKLKISHQIKHNRMSNSRYSLDLHTLERTRITNLNSSPSNSSPIPYSIDGAELSKIDSMMKLNKINLPDISTLALLTQLSLWTDPIEGLAHPTTIQALTAYIKMSKNSQVPLILKRIIKNHVYFLPLLLQGFVFKAQELENAHDYLRILCDTAESGGAFGEMAIVLLRGQESHKLMVAVSIPFLLQSKNKLRTLLGEYGGLELIFGLLVNEKHLLNENSVLSVCQLANALGIVPETTERRSSSSDGSHDNDNISNNDEDKSHSDDKTIRKRIVTFELDDGGTMDVCRRLLCIKSKAFCAMLEGSFYEAGQDRMRLPEVSREGLTMLCLTANVPLFNENDNRDLTIEALLDAVLVADKFLMFDEREKLNEISISQLCPGNLCRAWNWARLNDNRDLKMCCVKNFLTLTLSRNERLGAFHDFAANQNFKEFLDDIKYIITTELLIRQ